MRVLFLSTLAVALTCAGAGLAQEGAGQEDAGVFRDSDAEMTCPQISEEAARLGEDMGDATPSGGWLSSLGGIARSGAAMLVPGAGLAVAGVDAMRQPTRDRDGAEKAAVQGRWYYLNGLHIGRGCREASPVSVRTGALLERPNGDR